MARFKDRSLSRRSKVVVFFLPVISLIVSIFIMGAIIMFSFRHVKRKFNVVLAAFVGFLQFVVLGSFSIVFAVWAEDKLIENVSPPSEY